MDPCLLLMDPNTNPAHFIAHHVRSQVMEVREGSFFMFEDEAG
jgi:hypothetical protein